ncbi:hypothetical protein IG631_09417 [Alternaria alternata]|nr:hypothetical protein IG631_09417 [Alternaria alternata]
MSLTSFSSSTDSYCRKSGTRERLGDNAGFPSCSGQVVDWCLARPQAPQDARTRKLSPLKPANLPPICWAGCNLCADGALVLGVRGDGVAA